MGCLVSPRGSGGVTAATVMKSHEIESESDEGVHG